MTSQKNSQTENKMKEVPQAVIPTTPNWTFTLLPDKLHHPQPVASHFIKKDEKSSEKQRD